MGGKNKFVHVGKSAYLCIRFQQEITKRYIFVLRMRTWEIFIEMQASVIKKGEGEVDKLCRLMEMRDDGTISDEIYDAVLQKIS